MPTYLNQICRKNPPFLYNLRHGLFYTTNLQKATQVDQDFPPVETWMFSRSLEPLQPSPWAALAPSPTLVWPAKKNTSKLDINRRFMVHRAMVQRFKIRTVSSGKKTCLPENHPSFHD